MSNRRVDPRQHEYDSALRSALHMAVDSLEPAEGLDQIRAKITAKQSARRRIGWWPVAALTDGRSWRRVLLPPCGWFSAVVGAVTERFRPNPNRAGWFGWLRPAAAVTTGLFVVTAASWAVAALPSAVNPPESTKVFHTTSPAHKNVNSATKHHQSYTGPSGGVTTPYGNSSGGSTGSSTPSCSPSTSPSGGISSSGTPPSGSPAPSSGSSGTSTTPSSPATTPTANTPSSSPTAGVNSGTKQASSPTSSPVPADSPVATGKALLSLDAMPATKLAKASGAGGAAIAVTSSPPAPTDAPQPTASPTVSVPASPYPTSSPLPPPNC